MLDVMVLWFQTAYHLQREGRDCQFHVHAGQCGRSGAAEGGAFHRRALRQTRRGPRLHQQRSVLQALHKRHTADNQAEKQNEELIDECLGQSAAQKTLHH